MVVNVDEWVRSFGLELAFAGCAEAATIFQGIFCVGYEM